MASFDSQIWQLSGVRRPAPLSEQQTTRTPNDFSGFESASIEAWRSAAVLRGHLGDVTDVCWSLSDCSLSSASVDNSFVTRSSLFLLFSSLYSFIYCTVYNISSLVFLTLFFSQQTVGSFVTCSVVIWDTACLFASGAQASSSQRGPLPLAVLRGHTGLVKGVSWRPSGHYIATQAADKTLRIWRTSDWREDACLREPFKDCAGGCCYATL